MNNLVGERPFPLVAHILLNAGFSNLDQKTVSTMITFKPVQTKKSALVKGRTAFSLFLYSANKHLLLYLDI